MKNLIKIDDFSLHEIEEICFDTSKFINNEFDLNEMKGVFANKIAVIIFFENSTRTFLSFEIALKRLGFKTINLNVQASAFSKGESLLNFFKNVAAMHPDLLIVRHPDSTIFDLIQHAIKCPIINAGSGISSHTTQALLDFYTMHKHFSDLQNKNIAIIGDIKHSRVARSNVDLLTKFGANLTLIGPKCFLPNDLPKNIKKSYELTPEILQNQDVIMMLRIQFERHQQILSKNEYYKNFALREEHLQHLKSETIILHPGPANVSVEIDEAVMNSTRSKILEQVAHGVFVRMAVIHKLIK